MKNKRKLLVLIVVLGFLSIASADKKCYNGCHGPAGTYYKYEEGSTYKYKLEGTTITTVPGSQGDISKVSVSADVDISVQPQCSYVLKISGVHLTGPDGKAQSGLQELEAHPVKFSFNDGRIESEVCAEEGDSHSALNIKRAIISLLQSAVHKDAGVTSHVETDVFGTCPTDFEFFKTGNTLKIKKIRNLNQCAHRESLNVPVFSTPYNVNSDFQSSPLLISSSKVEQQVQDGIIHSVTGEEKYSYQPHATIESGVLVTVKTKLSFVSNAKGAPIAANVIKPESIIFDAPHETTEYSSVESIQKALDQAEHSVEPTVQPSAAQDFADLVEVLSHSKKADILAVFGGIKSKDTAKHILLDGIARASTGEAVEVLAELAQANELSKLQKNFWVSSLGFIKHVTKGSLKAVLPLLESGHRQVYLGVGSLAGRYCSQHDCDNDSEFKELINKLAEPIASGCKVDSVEKEDKIIASLKGLHNAHHLTNEVVDKLSQCAADKGVKTRIRVAALETFQSDAFKSKLKNTAISILKNMEEDSEIRIKAYLALAECPCGKVADTVKNVLENEQVNQVGSFITSHLRNLRASANPDKEAAKHYLSQIHVNKKFPVDIRKFSHNQELSYSIDAINLGASGESNVIFSEKSYIPRSYSLNLTTQFFGHAFNLIEFNARTENLDHIVERYFGPKGYFPTHDPKDIYENAFKSASALRNKISERYHETVRGKREVRHPRDIRQQTSQFANKVNLGIDSHDSNLDLDLSLKLYGSEVGWFSFHDNNRKFNPDEIIDKIFHSIDESFEKAKNLDIDFKKHTTFLDAEAIYPTGLGLPLKLNTKGSSAVRVKFDGKVDVPAIIKDPKNAYVKFQVIPSAAIELSGQLSVDAYVVESGVKVHGTVHTATGSDLSVRFIDGLGIDVKVGLPVKKQDIVSFNSDILTISKPRGHPKIQAPVKFDTKRQEYTGCFDQLSPIFGLTFCGKISYPFDSHKFLSPAYGPTNLALHIEKEDDSLTTYNFKAYYNKKEQNVKSLEILLDTPNSKTNRKLHFLATVGSEPKQITANINTPWKDITFDGRITDTDKEHTLSAKLLDDTTEYSVKTGVYISGDENRKTFKPILEYKVPEFKTKSGLVGVKAGKGTKSHHAVAVSGLIKLEKKPDTGYRKYTLESVSVITPSKTYKVDGTIGHGDNELETDLKGSYDKEFITLKSHLKKDFSDAGKKLKVYVETTSSEQPDFNFVLDWEYNRDKTSIGNVLSLVHGPNPKSEDHKITFNQYLLYKYENVKSFDFNTKNSVTYPLVSLSGTINGQATPSSFDYELKGIYEKYHVSSSLNAKTGIAKPGDYSVNFKGQVLDNSVDFNAKREILEETKSKFTNSLEFKPGGTYEANAIIVHNFQKDNFHNSIQSHIKFPAEPKELKFDAGLKVTKKVFESLFVVATADKKFVEFKAEINREHPSGEFVANLPPNFLSNGHFKNEAGKGAGAFVFHFPKQDRKIEGKSELTVSGTKHVGFIDIAWDATKHPEKKLRVETDSDLSKQNIDSKNTLIFKDSTTKFNYKGKVHSVPTEESYISEAELIFPSGRTFATAYNGKYTHQTDDYDGEVDFKFSDYISPGKLLHKIGFKLNAKNVNPAKQTFDGQVQLSYANADGKDANIQAALKKLLSGERWTISTSGAVTGSLPPYPVNFKFDSEVSEQFLKCRLAADNTLPFGTYNLIFTAGDLHLNGNGKVNQNQINNEVDVKLPSDYSITSLKWTTNNQFTPNEKIKTSNAINWNGDKFFKVSSEGIKEESGFSGRLEWESHLKSARVVTTNVHYKPTTGGDKKIDAALNFAYEGNVANVNLVADYEKSSEKIQVQLNGNLPQQGKFDVSVKNQVVNDGKGFQTDVILNVNEKKIIVTNHVVLDKENPLIDLVAEHPQGKSRVFFKIEKKSDHHYIGESKVKWVGNGGGNLAIDGEAKFESVEDFIFKVNADSPKLNIEKYHVEIANKPTKTSAKKISFSAKSADKILFAGSTSYNFKDEGNSKVIDGSGNIKVGDKSYPLNFKYVRNELTETDGEVGNQVKLNVKFGKNVYDLLGKLTTTTFLIRRTFTKESGETSKAEVSSHIKKNSVAEYDYEFNVILDLSKMFKDTEDLSLKINTKRDGFILDHNFELQRNPDSKIKYHLYVHEHQAGAVLTLPKRVVAAEAKYELPANKDKGIIQAEASLWLNKQAAPTEKTSVALNAEINKIGEGGSFSGEVRVTHPALGKDLVVSGHATILQQWNKLIDAKAEFDVFAKKEQKITIDYKSNRNKEKDGYTVNQNFRVKGATIDVDYKQNFIGTKDHLKYTLQFVYVDANKAKKESKIFFDVSPAKVEFLAKIPEGTLLSTKSNVKNAPNLYSVESNYEILGEKYYEHIEIKNQNNLQYTFIFDKGGKEKKFEGDFGFNLGQVAEINTKFDNKELGFVHVALDDGNFLKSKYSFNTDTFKNFVEVGKQDYVNAVKKFSKALQEAIDRISKDIVHQVEETQKSLPNFEAVVKAYTEQIEALRQEVINEKSIQEAADYIKGTLSVVLEQVVTVLEEAAKTIDSLVKLLNEAATKLSEAIKKLAPKVTEGYEKIAKIVVHLFEETLKYSVEVFNVILDKIKEHEEEIQVIVNATTEFLSEIGQLAAKVFVQFKGQIKDFIELFVEQIKALPIFSMIKEKLEELKTYEIPQQYWDDYHSFIASVKEVLPTPELSQFFSSLASYAEKLVRQQSVTGDDIKNLYKEFVAAIKSIIAFVQQHVPKEKLIQPSLIPLPTFTVWKIPKGAIRFSPINWFQSSDLPSVSQILYTYKPTINPIDYIPPYKGFGYIISNTQFFTFNGRHLSFKGNCVYILAQDFVDGNFSIAAKVENGKVKSVTVVDHKDSVELQSDGNVKVNGASSEFPVYQGDLRAWRRYPTANIYSKAGVFVHCTTDLEFCVFQVSGFYFGKTRGLLGRLNNEQFSDLTLPSGKIASSDNDFINAYKLGSCADISAPEADDHHKEPLCTGFFSSDSPLRLCYPGVDLHHYRHACNLITAEATDKKAAACKAASAYYAACSNNGIKVSLPKECIQCTIAGKTVGYDEPVVVKTPQNKADVVLVVEQVAENEEVFQQLVNPLVDQLTKEFAIKGIKDVHFSLIGFGGPNMKWPQHYTTNGKIDFNGKTTIYFTKKATPEKSEHEYYEKFKFLKHKFDVEVGNTQIHLAFMEAHQYPFRPDAIKTVIGVLGGPCEKSGLPVSLQHARVLLRLIFNRVGGVTLNLISNVHNFKQSGNAENAAPASDVVGFSKKTVYYLNGNQDDNTNHYTYDEDTCILFTEISGGIVYNSANFVSANPDAKKQFLNVLTGSIADSLTEKQKEFKCECTEKDGLPQTECIIENERDREASESESLRSKGGKKGIKA